MRAGTSVTVNGRTFWVLVVVAAVLTGCTGSNEQRTPATATTTTTTTPVTTDTSRPSVAPPVAAPVDLGPYERHACSLLTEQQQTDLGLRPAPFEKLPPQEAVGQFGSCIWADPPGEHDGPVYGYVIRIHTTGDLLAQAYGESNNRGPDPQWRVFTPTTIRNLPAVVRTFDDDLTSSCEIIIGAGNGQGLVVKGNYRDPDLYPRMDAMAELVVDAVRR